MMVKGDIAGVVFDLDGTLLDTEMLSFDALSFISSENDGKEFTTDLNMRILGTPPHEWSTLVLAELEIPPEKLTPSQLVKEWEKYLADNYHKVQLLPGAVTVTRLLSRTHDLPMAIATSSNAGAVVKKRLHHSDFFDQFNHVVCGDNPAVKHGKPEPDIFLLAAEKLKIPPSNILAFEDSPAGVKAAKAAGMFVVAIPDKRLDPSTYDTKYPNADVILRSLEDFDCSKWNFCKI